MPISLDLRHLLITCRRTRNRRSDKFHELRRPVDIASYVAFADRALDQGAHCEACGRQFTMDNQPMPKHRLAPCFGGTDEWSNLAALCRNCMRNAMAEEERRMAEWQPGSPAPPIGHSIQRAVELLRPRVRTP